MSSQTAQTDSQGYAQLPHGLNGVPTWVILQVDRDARWEPAFYDVVFAVTGVDAENVKFRVYQHTKPAADLSLPVEMDAVVDPTSERSEEQQ